MRIAGPQLRAAQESDWRGSRAGSLVYRCARGYRTTVSSDSRERVPRASPAETFGVLGDLVLPLVARGLLARRPRVVDLLDRADGDRRAIRRMQRLSERYGAG